MKHGDHDVTHVALVAAEWKKEISQVLNDAKSDDIQGIMQQIAKTKKFIIDTSDTTIKKSKELKDLFDDYSMKLKTNIAQVQAHKDQELERLRQLEEKIITKGESHEKFKEQVEMLLKLKSDVDFLDSKANLRDTEKFTLEPPDQKFSALSSPLEQIINSVRQALHEIPGLIPVEHRIKCTKSRIHIEETLDRIPQFKISRPRSMLHPTLPVPSSSLSFDLSDDIIVTEPVENLTCSLCMDEMHEPKTLACKHTFCSGCIDAWFQNKPFCPVCGKVYGRLTGNQPDGIMEHKIIGEPLPGYKCPTIEINYSFPPGIQGPDHPNPGARYQGTRRTAYLPNNKPGKEILRMLREAFRARLTFTIGYSPTTRAEDQIIWNGIHHKTSKTGGPERDGYPDETYLERVKAELANIGIE